MSGNKKYETLINQKQFCYDHHFIILTKTSLQIQVDFKKKKIKN